MYSRWYIFSHVHIPVSSDNFWWYQLTLYRSSCTDIEHQDVMGSISVCMVVFCINENV